MGRPSGNIAPLMKDVHQALLDLGVPVGHTFPGDEWDQILIVGAGAESAPTRREYTRIGAAHGLWSLQNHEGGAGRGQRLQVTLNA